MKWKIKVSSRARLDIQSALERTLAEFGEHQHDDYLDLIGIALAEIAVDPTSLRSRKRPEIHADARTFHIGRRGRKARHLFLYRINPKGLVEVGLFLHDFMDIQRHSSEGFEPDS